MSRRITPRAESSPDRLPHVVAESVDSIETWTYHQVKHGGGFRVYRGEIVRVTGTAGRQLRDRQADAFAALLAWATGRATATSEDGDGST